LAFHFTAPLNSTGGWQTNYSNSGVYTATVSVDDGHGGTDSQDVTIMVLEWGNHAPVLDPIEDITVTEGELAKLTPSATDIDGDQLAFHFTAPLNSAGEWQTNYSNSGVYTATVSVDDGHGGTDSQQVQITVLESGNHAPIIDPLPDITIVEGGLVNIVPHATDPDGDQLTITFTPPLNSSGKWQTDFTDSGVYTVSVGASDGILSAVRSFKITVLESGNHAPILDQLPDITVTEGEKVSVVPTAYDPDEDLITFSFSSPLDSDGQWQTDFTDQGIYTATVTASDGKGGSTSKSFKITVLDWGNHNPVLQPISDITVTEGELIIVNPVASDVDGDNLTISFASPLNSAGRWQTNYSSSGEYLSSVTVTDGRGGSDTKNFKITVLESGNHAPVVGPLDDLTVIEGELVKIKVDAYDPDGDQLTITFTGVLNQNGEWQTQKDQLGDFGAGVIVSDGTASVVKTFIIHVIETPVGLLRVNNINMPDFAKPGDRLEITINLQNTGTKTIKNLKARGTLADLGTTAVSKQVEIKPGKTATLRLYLDVPGDAKPGEYDIGFSISNDELRRTKYRPIVITR
jgi:hypothetical protein